MTTDNKEGQPAQYSTPQRDEMPRHNYSDTQEDNEVEKSYIPLPDSTPQGDETDDTVSHFEFNEEGDNEPMTDKELKERQQYPIQDDVWPSRRWNKERTEYIDLSGSESIGEMKWVAWGETITISNFEGDTLRINPNGDYDKGIPSTEDRNLAERVVKSINDYPKLLQQNQQQARDIKELKEWEKLFYMAVCRAYNAGKQNQINIVLAKGSPDEDKMFLSSHDYFKTEFPEFKTNVP